MMKQLKRIVVGIDISEKSDNVLKRALIIARENEAELCIVHAVETPWLSVPSYFGSKDLVIDIEGIKKKIDKKLKTLNTDNKVSYMTYVKEDDADSLLLYAEKWFKADMIMLGAHSKTKGRKRFLGSIVQKVVHQSHLPVLVVKKNAKGAYKNIVAPTDFQAQSKQSIIFVKNIFPRSKIAKREMKKFIKEVTVKKGNVIDGEFDSKEALVNYINNGSYDLVVVGSRGTAGFGSLLGSVSTYLLRETECDVLIYVPVE